MIKQAVCVFDLDGTLLTKDHVILEENLQALNALEAAGHYVCVATGRSYLYAKDVLTRYDLRRFILCNGAGAYWEDQWVYELPLDQAAFSRLRDYAKTHHIDIAAQSLFQTLALSQYEGDRIARAMMSFGAPVPELGSIAHFDAPIVQALLFCDRNTSVPFEAFPEFQFIRWHDEALDVLPEGASKARTLDWVLTQQGLSHLPVIAFGDGDNDVALLSRADYGFAMGNASMAAKECADHVIGDHNTPAIFETLRQLELITV